MIETKITDVKFSDIPVGTWFSISPENKADVYLKTDKVYDVLGEAVNAVVMSAENAGRFSFFDDDKRIYVLI